MIFRFHIYILCCCCYFYIYIRRLCKSAAIKFEKSINIKLDAFLENSRRVRRTAHTLSTRSGLCLLSASEFLLCIFLYIFLMGFRYLFIYNFQTLCIDSEFIYIQQYSFFIFLSFFRDWACIIRRTPYISTRQILLVCVRVIFYRCLLRTGSARRARKKMNLYI